MNRSGDRIPGTAWRVLARHGEREIKIENEGTFDELVVGQWLHIEQMTDTSWRLRVRL
jgi:hypothetical protein